MIGKLKLNWLEQLNISHNSIRNKGVKYLSQAQWLNFKKIIANYVDITPACFRYFSKMEGKNGTVEVVATLKHVNSDLLNRLPLLNVFKARIIWEADDNIEQMVMLNTLANANTIVKYPSCNRIINRVKQHASCSDILKSLSSI